MAARRLWIVFAAGLAALLGYAWINGGEVPVRDIVEPVALPGSRS